VICELASAVIFEVDTRSSLDELRFDEVPLMHTLASCILGILHMSDLRSIGGMVLLCRVHHTPAH
jgi:hypothetical protein